MPPIPPAGSASAGRGEERRVDRAGAEAMDVVMHGQVFAHEVGPAPSEADQVPPPRTAGWEGRRFGEGEGGDASGVFDQVERLEELAVGGDQGLVAEVVVMMPAADIKEWGPDWSRDCQRKRRRFRQSLRVRRQTGGPRWPVPEAIRRERAGGAADDMVNRDEG
jgi:hypothetical protein